MKKAIAALQVRFVSRACGMESDRERREGGCGSGRSVGMGVVRRTSKGHGRGVSRGDCADQTSDQAAGRRSGREAEAIPGEEGETEAEAAVEVEERGGG